MQTLSANGKIARTNMSLREDNSPRNALYFNLIRGEHAYPIWDMFSPMRERRLYEVMAPFFVTVRLDNGDWLGLEARPGYRFDGPTGYALDYGSNQGLAWLWGQAAKAIGLSGRWWRSPWLPASAHHDWPVKVRREHARMLLNGEPIDNVPRWMSDQAFKNLLIAWGANPWSVSIAMRIIRLYRALK